MSFSFPEYHTGKVCYVGFYCVDPSKGEMRRKRYKLDHIKGTKQRKQYAMLLIQTLVQRLVSGWSPWGTEAPIRTRTAAEDVFSQYKKSVEHDGVSSVLRPDTVKSYLSYLNVFTEYVKENQMLNYIDELTTGKVQKFLDYLVQEKSLSIRTHNNYLTWLGVFCRWLQKHDYVKELPTDAITPLRDKKEKNRVILTSEQLNTLRDYCEQHNKHYLLVCYLIYYCMIRPKELSMLTIGNIRLKDGVIHVPGDVSKNRTGSNVTLPTKVIHLMLDLKIFDYPSQFYLFSEDFAPGKNFRKCKPMSDYWDYHIRRDLGWGKELKLYSLKDTGITTLLHKVDVLTVRDQARHSDISITNIYASRSQSAVKKLQDWDADSISDRKETCCPKDGTPV